jgi:hypothetical protein
LLALELIDSGLLLARRRGETSEVLTEVPGIAFLGDDTTRTGEAAVERIRLNPLLAHTNFWRGLSTEDLTRPSRLVRTTADIAFAQANELLGPHKSDGESVLLAVPAGYSREQLPLLLGVINETGIRVCGLVDAALAACSLEPAPARVLHLDLELHQAILTVLEYSGGDRSGLKRSRYEIVLRHGVLDLNQTVRQLIAETFIRKTRFDPLHDATTEQRLVGQVPALLGQLREQEQTVVGMQFGDRPLEVEIERAQVIAALEPHYAELLRLVQSARVAGMQIQLRLAPRIAAFPDWSSASARCAIARSTSCRAVPRRSERCSTKLRSVDPTRSRSSTTCRSRGRPAVNPLQNRKRRLRRCGRRTCSSRAGRGEFPTSRSSSAGRSTRSVARCCCRAPRPVYRVPIARWSGATAPSWSRITALTVPT